MDIDSYVKTKRLEIGTYVSKKKIIYLDTNYWQKLKKQEEDIYKDILAKSIRLVASNKCIFPFSEAIFWEIFKQSDIASLKRTSNLVDELSQGISLITSKELLSLEFKHFIRSRTQKNVHDLNELVWTKLFFVVGNGLPMPTDEALFVSFYEFISKLSLSDVISMIEEGGNFEPLIHKDNVNRMNEEKEKYRNENSTFDALFISELIGCVDIHKGILGDAMVQMYYKDTGRMPEQNYDYEKNAEQLKILICNGFKLGKIIKELPSLHILPELFASMRWNRDRKYKDGNDTMDTLHASFALPYCDFFFTEKELKTMIIQRKLDSRYNCVVESNPKEVLRILNSF
ncbi:MAG: hypothetical protein RLZZ367_720 [Bacteroidota bacterium]|jgi:hypothetical protein